MGVHTLCAGSLYAASRRTSLDTQEIVRQYWPLKDTEKHTKEHLSPNFTPAFPNFHQSSHSTVGILTAFQYSHSQKWVSLTICCIGSVGKGICNKSCSYDI